jgi:hypothetical protein
MADLYRFSEADLENELPKLRDSDGEPMKPAERIRLMDDCTLTHSWLAGWLPTCLLVSASLSTLPFSSDNNSITCAVVGRAHESCASCIARR